MTTAAEARPAVGGGLRIALFANLAGSAGTALLQIAFVPLQVRLLGIEAYGLVGFYASLQAVLFTLDLGVSATVNRELARLTAQPDRAAAARDLVRTLEAWYWAVGAVLGGTIALAAPSLAHRWIQTASIPTATAERAIMLMGALVALQWPISLYQGGLLGLHRQVRLNTIRIAAAVVSIGGSVLVLLFVSRAVTSLFAWQALASLGQIVVLTVSLWRALPRPDLAPRVDLARLKEVWRFAAGAGGILLSGAVLSQLDKIAVSRLLPLGAFGYYALAATLGNGLYLVCNPVFGAVFPRLSALCAADDRPALAHEYRRGLQVMAVLVLPVAFTLAFFASAAIRAWTGSADAAATAGPLTRLLILGTALNALMHLPYALQLAHGYTRIGLWVNPVLVAVMAPATLFATARFGTGGAAAAWLVTNVLYVLVALPWTHRRLIGPRTVRWWIPDVGPALAASLVVAGAARAWSPMPLSRPGAAALLVSICGAALGLSALVTAETRRWLLARLGR